MFDTYYCDYLPHTTFHFYITDFRVNTEFAFFTIKSPNITQGSVSQEHAYKRA